MKEDERRYFIVKHGLDAFTALPNFIWRTGLNSKTIPRLFNRVRVGDLWAGFAYTSSDYRERPLSLITGFFECVHEKWYGSIPDGGLVVADGEERAWMIEGKPFKWQPRKPVGVPPITDILGRKVFNQAAIIPIKAGDFEKLRATARSREFDTSRIPLLEREPRSEQELLAVLIACHRKIGIERILRVQTRFPDLLVKLDGHNEEVHLELELYSQSYRLHGHATKNKKFTDGKPVAVLCWIDDAKGMGKDVHRVFELQSLLREGERIEW